MAEAIDIYGAALRTVRSRFWRESSARRPPPLRRRTSARRDTPSTCGRSGSRQPHRDRGAHERVAGGDGSGLSRAPDRRALDRRYDGHNFRHVLDISTHEAFAVAGRRYLVEYRFAPVRRSGDRRKISH